MTPLIEYIGIRNNRHVGVSASGKRTGSCGKRNGILGNRDLHNAMDEGSLFANFGNARHEVFATEVGTKGEEVAEK